MDKTDEAKKSSGEKASVRSVDRAFQILSCFSAEKNMVSLTEIAQEVNLPLSTVSRLLSTLESADFVRRMADSRYMPGGSLLRIGVRALHGVELHQISGEHLERLAAKTSEAANLAVFHNDTHAIYIRQIPSRHDVSHGNWIGKTVPLIGTAIGRALRGDLEANGYVISAKTLEQDVTAIAAPVFGADGKIVAAINVTLPSYRATDDFIKSASETLLSEARNLSFNLGAPIDNQ